MSEGECSVPRLGRVAAEPGFRLVAAMNPFDAVGTARISGAIYDRTCRISMGYQAGRGRAADRRPPGLRDPGWRARSSPWSAGPASTPTSGSARRSAARSTSARLAVELARIRGTGVDDWHVGLAAAKARPCPAGSGCTRAATATPSRPWPSSTSTSSAGAYRRDPADPDPRGGEAGGTLSPPRRGGLTSRPPAAPVAAAEIRAADHRPLRAGPPPEVRRDLARGRRARPRRARLRAGRGPGPDPHAAGRDVARHRRAVAGGRPAAGTAADPGPDPAGHPA